MSVFMTFFYLVLGSTLCFLLANKCLRLADKCLCKQYDRLGVFFILLGVAGCFFMCVVYPMKLTVATYSYSLVYDKPDAIIRTNYITTVVYKNKTFQYHNDAQFYICPESNIFVQISHNTNGWGYRNPNDYSCVITNTVWTLVKHERIEKSLSELEERVLSDMRLKGHKGWEKVMSNTNNPPKQINLNKTFFERYVITNKEEK